MSKKKKIKIASYLLILFVWQVTFLCIGHTVDPNLKSQYASVLEDIQEEEGESSGFESSDSVTDGFDWTEILEEDGKLCPDFSFQKIPFGKFFQDPCLSGNEIRFVNNLFSPPELNVHFSS